MHRTPEPKWSTFSGVVSRENSRITLTRTALKDLTICSCDVQNSYFQEPSCEKNYDVRDPDFGLENACKDTKIVRALRGGKSAGSNHW